MGTSPIRSAPVSFEKLERRRLLAAGDLDLSFGGGDAVATFSSQPASQVDRGLFTAIDSQGRIITVGVTAANRNFGTPVDILITRSTPEGLTDPLFGTGGSGMVTRSFLNADVATDLAVQPDNKILVAFRNAAPAGWGVLRLNEDGSPDAAFGNSGAAGVAAYDILGGAENITRIVLQPDGKIVTVGGASTGTSGSSPSQATVVRMMTDGSLDFSFAGDGIATTEFSPGGLNEFFDVALDTAGGRIVAAGRARAAPLTTSLDRIAVARFRSSDGELDGTFGGGDGLAEIAPVPSAHHLAHSVAVDGSSRVVVTGFVPPSPVLAPVPLNFFRLTAAGEPDATFNAAGPGRLEFPQATLLSVDLGDLLVQPDGKYLFGGAYTDATSNAYQFVRVDADGTPDETFSDDGVVHHRPTTPLTSGGTDVALDAQRRAVMSGVVVVNGPGNDFDFASVRVDLGLDVPNEPVSLAGGVLTIRGTDADDTVVLRRDGGQFLVTMNGADYTFPYAAVQSIDVELRGGNDQQTHDGGVPGGRIDLGAGPENWVTLNAGNRADAVLNVYGGSGNDTVTINPAAFTPVFFDGGNDGDATDYLVYHGSQGNDTLNLSTSRIDNEGLDEVDYARISSITVYGNVGFDTFNVTGTAAQSQYIFEGGDGDDGFVLINGAPDTQLASTSIDGGSGNDSFTYDDSAGGSTQNTTIDGNLANFNGNQVQFAVESLRYVNGPAARAVFVGPSSSTRMTIEGSAPADYPGDLLTIDPSVTPATHTRTNFRDGGFTFGAGAFRPVDYTGFERVVSTFDTAAPTATGRFNYQDRQEIEVEFSEDVYLSLEPADLELTNLTTGQVFPALVMNVNIGGANSGKGARWQPFASQPLPDGNYRARILASAVRDYADKPLESDLLVEFYVLAGDANRDRSVDFNDLALLAQNYNTSGAKTFGMGDFNYDDNVDFDDLAILAQRYNTSLAVPAPAVAASASGLDESQGSTRPAQARRPAANAVFNAAVPIKRPGARPARPAVSRRR